MLQKIFYSPLIFTSNKFGLNSLIINRNYSQIQKVDPPNKNWKPKDTKIKEIPEIVSLQSSELKTAEIYKLLIGSIVPRPIGFVSTISNSGVVNLAPFSFFSGVASTPPTLQVSIVRKPDGGKKDTQLNIEENKEFVVNIVSEDYCEAMHNCSADYPRNISELEENGFTKIDSTKIKPPRILESQVQMECKLYNSMLVGDGGVGSSTIFVGEILCFHVHQNTYLGNGKIDLQKLKPVARLGGASYSNIRQTFDIPRAKYENKNS